MGASGAHADHCSVSDDPCPNRTLLSSVLIAILSLLAISSYLIPTPLDPASIKAHHLHVYVPQG